MSLGVMCLTLCQEKRQRQGQVGQAKAGEIMPSLASSPGSLLPLFLRREPRDEANDGVVLMHNKHHAFLDGGCCGWVLRKPLVVSTGRVISLLLP